MPTNSNSIGDIAVGVKSRQGTSTSWAKEERFLHSAACHGCLLIAETSCERYNEYLDRELVVPKRCQELSRQ